MTVLDQIPSVAAERHSRLATPSTTPVFFSLNDS